MDDKPEFYTLAEVVDHLKDIVPSERIEIDIGRGLLRIGAALPPLAGCDHHSRELLERHGADMDEFDKSILRRVKRPRQVWLETGLAVAVLRSSEGAALTEAEYPVFIDANGKTERYLVEHVEFPESTLVVRADLVVFSFDLWAYLYRLGKISDAKRDPLPKLNTGGRHMIGRYYSIKEQEAIARMHDRVNARYALSGRAVHVNSQRDSVSTHSTREIEFVEDVLLGRTRYPAGSRSTFDYDEASDYIWRGWARDPRTGEQGEKFTGTTVIRPDSVVQGRVAAELGSADEYSGAAESHEPEAESHFTADDIARQFWGMRLNLHRAMLAAPVHTGCAPVQRVVHVLALQQFFKLIAEGGTVQYRPEFALERYAKAAFSLSAAISNAAKSGALKLRDSSTGVPLAQWQDPNPNEFWEHVSPVIRGRSPAKSGSVSLYLLCLPMHFKRDVVVNLEEFEVWAVGEKLTGPGELARLLSEGTPDDVARLVDGQEVEAGVGGEVVPARPRSPDSLHAKRPHGDEEPAEKRRPGRPKKGDALDDRLPELREAAVEVADRLERDKTVRRVAEKLSKSQAWGHYGATTLRKKLRRQWWEGKKKAPL